MCALGSDRPEQRHLLYKKSVANNTISCQRFATFILPSSLKDDDQSASCSVLRALSLTGQQCHGWRFRRGGCSSFLILLGTGYLGKQSCLTMLALNEYDACLPGVTYLSQRYWGGKLKIFTSRPLYICSGSTLYRVSASNIALRPRIQDANDAIRDGVPGTDRMERKNSLRTTAAQCCCAKWSILLSP